MSYKLPPENQWTQMNKGDSSGSLWSTFNVDLTTKAGDTKVTSLIHSASTSSDLVNLGTPIGFVKNDNGGGLANAPFYTVAGTRVFKESATSSHNFIQDASSGTPTTCDSQYSDLIVFNGSLYVTTASNSVYKISTGSWSNFTAGSTDNTSVHALCRYANRVYMSRAYSEIISWDTSDTVVTSPAQYALQLNNSAENVITFMKPASDKIWIGTVNSVGGIGSIYSWDGSSGNPVRYVLESTGAMSCVIKNDVPYVMDNNGRLLEFNGGTFKEIAKLPNYRKRSYVNSLSASNNRWIHPNGMAIVEGRVNILVNTQEVISDSSSEEMCPSGIWEYDKDIGLYHKYTPSYYDYNLGSGQNDFGQQRIVTAGGLAYAKSVSSSVAANGTLLAGFQYYTDSSSTKYGIFYDDNADLILKAGYIVTTKIPSSGISDVWQRFVLKYNNLLNASDKIVVKYRLVDTDPLEGVITWSNTSHFTTSLDLSSYAVGDEVEIVQGTGGGMCAHITAMSLASGVYDVTVDETFTGVTTGTARARFQKWKKLGTIADVTSTFKVMPFPTTASSSFIQLKVWMMMYGNDEMKELDIQNIVSQKL